MLRTLNRLFFSIILFSLAVNGARAQSKTTPDPDLTKDPTLYVVGYAHLDTQWRWEYPQVIREYLPKTMHDNFALFEKYPHYVFNFSGANRYRMMKEYWPEDYAKLKQYVAAGRWFPSGSSMEEGDVNSPSAESIIRQILYGTHFVRRELGRTSAEYMLPDCFGFPAALPSVLAHIGIPGFSTQKLTWGSSAPGGGGGGRGGGEDKQGGCRLPPAARSPLPARTSATACPLRHCRAVVPRHSQRPDRAAAAVPRRSRIDESLRRIADLRGDAEAVEP